MPSSFDPADALAAVDTTRASLADRLVTPVWYHPTLALAMAALCLFLGLPDSHGSDRPSWRFPLLLTLWVIPIALPMIYRKMTGIAITGPTGTHSRKVLTLTVAGMAIPLGLAVANDLAQGPAWVAITCGLLSVVLTIALGRHYDESLRADLHEAQSR